MLQVEWRLENGFRSYIFILECRGRFGLVIGLNRTNHREDLLSHGADIVIDDFSEVSIWSINDAFPYASTQVIEYSPLG
jgi:hypothetical protein